MKKKEIELSYHTFNDRRFVRQFKNKIETAIFVNRFKITDCDVTAKENNKTIISLLKSIVRNPIVFENELIYLAIIEVTSFMDFLEGFKESISNVSSIDGLKMRHGKYIERQDKLITHLRELSENPNQAPSFIKNQL